MKTIDIRDFLKNELDVSLNDLSLGEFDLIGEFTAKKCRSKDDSNFKNVGAFFRPNYERGILVTSLIKRYLLTSLLEIGFGRGYTSVCAAKTFYELGNGSVTSIDISFDENQLALMKQTFPENWLRRITLMQSRSDEALQTLSGSKYELVYIDGDHTYEGVKKDWELSKNLVDRFVLFDDYHLPTKNSGPGIQVARLVDEIDWDKEGYEEPTLIQMDRRIFFDDRKIPDNEIDYGQVLIKKKDR